MNVKQALKAKNKLVAEIKECYRILQTQNSIEEGNPRRYSVKKKLEDIAELTDELVQLKARLHRANAPVYDKIFALAELKGMIKELKKVPTDEGKSSDRYSSIPSVKEVELNVTDIDNSISILETQIEELQNELDVHNATTNI